MLSKKSNAVLSFATHNGIIKRLSSDILDILDEDITKYLTKLGKGSKRVSDLGAAFKDIQVMSVARALQIIIQADKDTIVQDLQSELGRNAIYTYQNEFNRYLDYKHEYIRLLCRLQDLHLEQMYEEEGNL